VGVEGVRAVDVSAETRGRRDVEKGTPGGEVHPGTDGPPLTELLAMALSQDAWESFSRGSAIRRAGRAGFARNVCVALGNSGSSEAVPVLARALADPNPLVRGHAAWALGQVGGAAARELLSSAASSEEDAGVIEELEAARSEASGMIVQP
jgi:epoxyqueuosine reductase